MGPRSPGGFDLLDAVEVAQALAQALDFFRQGDVAEGLVDLVVQRDERRHPGAAPIVEFGQQRAARAAALRRRTGAREPRRSGRWTAASAASSFGVSASPFADEDVDVQLEPVALASTRRARGPRSRRRSPGRRSQRRQRVVEPNVDVFPRRDDVTHEGRRTLDIVQRERVAAARDETGVEKAMRKRARGARREAHEAAVVRRDRAVHGERRRSRRSCDR